MFQDLIKENRNFIVRMVKQEYPYSFMHAWLNSYIVPDLMVCIKIFRRSNPLTAKLFNLNFHSLEVVSRWRDPQLQVSENYSDLTKWRSTVFKYCWLMSHFIFNMFKRWYLYVLIKNENPNIYAAPAVKGLRVKVHVKSKSSIYNPPRISIISHVSITLVRRILIMALRYDLERMIEMPTFSGIADMTFISVSLANFTVWIRQKERGRGGGDASRLYLNHT